MGSQSNVDRIQTARERAVVCPHRICFSSRCNNTDLFPADRFSKARWLISTTRSHEATLLIRIRLSLGVRRPSLDPSWATFRQIGEALYRAPMASTSSTACLMNSSLWSHVNVVSSSLLYMLFICFYNRSAWTEVKERAAQPNRRSCSPFQASVQITCTDCVDKLRKSTRKVIAGLLHLHRLRKRICAEPVQICASYLHSRCR